MNRLVSQYYRSKLNLAERHLYDLLYCRWSRRERISTFPGCWTKTDVITKIVNAIMLDHPSLFWVDYYQYSLSATPFATELKLAFFFDGAQLEDLNRQATAWQARIIGALPVNARAVDKAWLIFDYLARQVTYGEQSNAYSHTIVGPMSRYNHVAVCEGIAKSYKFLCDGAGIPCIIVSGAHFDFGHSEPHAWNIVECAGRTFHVDVTVELEYAHYSGRAGQDTFLHIDQDMQKYRWDRNSVPHCD